MLHFLFLLSFFNTVLYAYIIIVKILRFTIIPKTIIMKYPFILCCLLSTIVQAQPLKIKNNQGGLVSFGVRTTLSAFNDGETGPPGFGVGGQYRIQVSDKVNTDWYFDYITSDVGDYAHRTDHHIGWSVLFYPTKKLTPKVRPYILAGHCFDHTEIVDNTNRSNSIERWSSAVQGGLGVHFNLSDRLDISVVSQYMVHLGTDVHSELIDDLVVFHKEKGSSLEGHLLFHVGINYKIADLW